VSQLPVVSHQVFQWVMFLEQLVQQVEVLLTVLSEHSVYLSEDHLLHFLQLCLEGVFVVSLHFV